MIQEGGVLYHTYDFFWDFFLMIVKLGFFFILFANDCGPHYPTCIDYESSFLFPFLLLFLFPFVCLLIVSGS